MTAFVRLTREDDLVLVNRRIGNFKDGSNLTLNVFLCQ